MSCSGAFQLVLAIAFAMPRQLVHQLNWSNEMLQWEWHILWKGHLVGSSNSVGGFESCDVKDFFISAQLIGGPKPPMELCRAVFPTQNRECNFDWRKKNTPIL